MKRFVRTFLAIFVIAFTGWLQPAFAQGGGVAFIPPITPGDCAKWLAANILQDAGACGTGAGGFPITLGSTSITGGSTTTSVTGLSIAAGSNNSGAFAGPLSWQSNGAISAAFGTTGVSLIGSAYTQTDSTTGVGTVTTAYGSLIGANTFATAVNAVTITNGYNVYFKTPVAGSHVTGTSLWALGADSAAINGNAVITGSLTGMTFVQLSSGSNGVWNASGLATPNTGGLLFSSTSNAAGTIDTTFCRSAPGVVEVGASTGCAASGALTLATLTVSGANVKFPGLGTSSAGTTGTLCWTTITGLVNVDTTTTCLLSLEELKDIRGPISGAEALFDVLALKPFWGTWKKSTPEYVGDKAEQPFLGAHQVASVDKRLAAYAPNGALHGVRYQELTAILVGAIKAQQSEIYILILWNVILTAGFGLLFFRPKL